MIRMTDDSNEYETLLNAVRSLVRTIRAIYRAIVLCHEPAANCYDRLDFVVLRKPISLPTLCLSYKAKITNENAFSILRIKLLRENGSYTSYHIRIIYSGQRYFRCSGQHLTTGLLRISDEAFPHGREIYHSSFPFRRVSELKYSCIF